MNEKKHFFYLSCAIILLVIIFFYRLGRADVTGDSATYLYRSWGYIDYLNSQQQTTPLQWLKTVPGWLRLGFHDAPPLGFILNYLTLNFGNGSVLAARALNAFFGVVLGTLFFWYVLRRANIWAAAVCLTTYIALTPLILLQRTNLLESSQLIWLALGMFAIFIAPRRVYFWYLAALFFGMAVLTKYTALFFLLGPLLALFTNQQNIKNKHVWLALPIFLITISPIAIYNFMLWRTVGHPDLQFSILMHSNIKEHWSVITRATSSFTLSNRVIAVAATLKNSVFPSVLILLIGSLLIAVKNLWQRREHCHEQHGQIVALGAWFGCLFGLFFTGTEYWFLAGFWLASAFLIAQALIYLARHTPTRVHNKNAAIFCLVILLAGGGIITTVKNAHALDEPTGIWATPAREPNAGWNELDQKINRLLNSRYPHAIANPWGLYEKNRALGFEFERIQKPYGNQVYNGIIFYDQRLPWFNRLWYLERWNLYRRFINLSVNEFGEIAEKDPTIIGPYFNPDEFSLIVSLTPFNDNTDRHGLYEKRLQVFIDQFEKKHAPNKIIRDAAGIARFKIYGLLATID